MRVQSCGLSPPSEICLPKLGSPTPPRLISKGSFVMERRRVGSRHTQKLFNLNSKLRMGLALHASGPAHQQYTTVKPAQ